jgi:subtilisin family serine protease
MLLVGVTADASTRAESLTLRAIGATIVHSYSGGPDVVRLPAGMDIGSAIGRLKATPSVRYVEADSTIQIDRARLKGTDPLIGKQWGLNNPNNVDIDAPEAWSVTTGAPSTVVAVIDSGLDVGNPDFAGRLWTNPNGGTDRSFPGDLHGWNFLDGSGNIQDNNGHGTHVAGTIAATGNNGYGIAGVDWGARIMPLKFIASDGSGSIDNAVAAIYFAVDHGAAVINASWGGNDQSPALDDAIRYAWVHNVVFVTAAGNESANNDLVRSYPADDRLPNQISVAAIDQNGNLATFSNYGPTTVDLAAPGVDIKSTVPGGFATYSGTSMAAPFVTGVVALVRGQFPQLSAAQAVQRVLGTTKPLSSLAGKTVTGGVVDAYYALTHTPAAVTVTGVPATNESPADDVQATILASDEFYRDQGSTPAGFVDGVYHVALGRPADPNGMQVWVGQLVGGASRGDVAKRILTSAEARRTQIGRWFISDLARPLETLDALKNDPTVVAWANAVIGGFTTMDNVRSTIFASQEFQSLHAGTPVGLIDTLYHDLLGRPADSGALAVWVGQLQNGASPASIAQRILTSPEARRTQVASWFVTDLGRPASALEAIKSDPTVIGWGALLGS